MRNNGLNNGFRSRGADSWLKNGTAVDFKTAAPPTIKPTVLTQIWHLQVDLAVKRVAKKLQFFTTDDVWIELNQPHPSNNNAIGSAMKRARNAKVCKATDRYKKTTRKSGRGRALAVWESLLFGDT